MADAPEIPEAKDRFETVVAISIAVIAVVLSWVSNFGDNAKTNAIIKTNEASNKWGHFQSKSIKEKLIDTSVEIAMSASGPAVNGGQEPEVIGKLRQEVARYETEKKQIQLEAEALQAEAAQSLKVNDRCDSGSLMLQVAIVLSSVAILARSNLLWIVSLVLASVGTVVGISSHFI